MCSCKDVRTCTFKGEVTSLNETLCQFTLDDRFKVYACFKFRDTNVKLPNIGEETIIRKIIMPELNCFFLTDNSVLSCCDYKVSKKAGNFVKKYINELKLGIRNILYIEKIIEDFKTMEIFSGDHLKNVTETIDDIILEAFSHFGKLKNVETVENCRCNRALKDVAFMHPFKFKCLDNGALPIKNGPHYTFTIQNNNIRDVFIGYLSFNEQINRITLTETKYGIVCLILRNKNSLEIKNFLNKFVVIKKYIFVREAHQDVSPDNEYLCFNAKDVIVLDLNYKNTLPVRNDLNLQTYHLKVVHKGPIYFNTYIKTTECWILVDINAETTIQCFISSKHLLKINSYLCCGDILQLSLPKTGNLEELFSKYITRSNIELNRVSNVPAYTLPDNFVIELLKNSENRPKVSSLEELSNAPATGSSTVSFVGILCEKQFSAPLPSRTSKKNLVKSKMFGTPGTQTHLLRIQDVKDHKRKVTVYLNNWETIHCPIGLIPGMKIIVRYVIPQKTYYKSCILTYFEPVVYYPSMRFNTCYELTNNSDWGPMSYLGIGNKIPCNVISWCRINVIRIRSVKINSSCVICKNEANYLQEFCCGQRNFELKFMLTFLASDTYSTCTVITPHIEILGTILKLKKQQIQLLRDYFTAIKKYQYLLSNYEEIRRPKLTNNDRISIINDTLNVLFYTQGFYFKDLDLKCRNLRTNNDSILWFGVEARTSL